MIDFLRHACISCICKACKEMWPWHDGRSVRAQGLLDKLQSDTTRLAAVKAFGRIAESPLPLDMAPVLDRLLSELTSYLRKSNRLLRQAALAAIEVCSPYLQPPRALACTSCKIVGKAGSLLAICSLLPPKLRQHL